MKGTVAKIGLKKYLKELGGGSIEVLFFTGIAGLIDKIGPGGLDDPYRDLTVGSGLTIGISDSAAETTAGIIGFGVSLCPELTDLIISNDFNDFMSKSIVKGMWYGISCVAGDILKYKLGE